MSPESGAKKWFECSVCHQRYGHPDGLRHHELKAQHSKASARIEEEVDKSSTTTEEASVSQATYRVYVENSSIE